MHPLAEASVLVLLIVSVAVHFALTGLGSPMIILFGLADLAGGIWTYSALRADARWDGTA